MQEERFCREPLAASPPRRLATMGRATPGLAVALGMAALVALGLVAGCESAAERLIVAGPQGSLTLVFAADNEGVLSSCGCPSNPSGGLAKRQTILDKYRRVRPDLVVVDAGDLFPDRPNSLKVPYLASAVEKARYDAIALGDQECLLGAAEIRRLARECKLPLLCANVRDESDNPIVPGHVVRTVGGRRVGIFAVISPAVMPIPPQDWRKGLRIAPPLEAARREVEALAGCDLIVALSHQSIQETTELARSVPGIHVVVSGHDETLYKKPVLVGTTTVVATGPVGRMVGALTITRGPDGSPAFAQEMTGLSEKVPDAGWIMDIYWQYVKKAKGEPPPAWALTPDLPDYEPAEKCAKCHEAEFKQWATTRHSRAYESIKRVRRNEDPECILCHTMGYGRENGFFSMEETPALGRVTCQACHPVMSTHHDDAKKAEPPKPLTARACLLCHGLIQSPDFDFAAYKPKIAHGKPVAPAADKPEENRRAP